MRYTDRPRILWADAICIDQLNKAEREGQVQLMRSIFSKAQQTLIFLGDVEEKKRQQMSKFTLWTLKLGLSILRRRVDMLTSPQIRVWDEDKGQPCILAPFSFEFYLELIGMLRMPWFQRAWVVQEVAVSSKATIFWGSSQYDWEDVIRALKFMSEVNFPLAFIATLENISAIEEERTLYRKGHNKLNGVLLRHQRCTATDFRDKIYSFCGLVKTPPGHNLVRISYEDDVSTIYREVALKILEEDQSLRSLEPTAFIIGYYPEEPSLMGARLEHLFRLNTDLCLGSRPSPTGRDTTRQRFSKFSLFNFSRIHILTQTLPQESKHSGRRRLPIRQSHQSRTNVSRSASTPHRPLISRNSSKMDPFFLYSLQGTKRLRAWQKLANVRSNLPYVTGETMREAFLQTFSAAEIHDYERVKVEIELWEKGTSFPFGLMYSLFVFVGGFLTNRPFLLFEIQGRYALHRRMVRTQGGFLGLASHATEVGDHVLICKGSSVPLIVRKCEDVDEGFRLVGDAYVHGIMRGEAFESDKCREILIK